MAKPIYFVGGGKGGVGKSMVAMALTDFLQLRGEPVVVVETDTGNPDVQKAYENSVRCELLDLDERDGWVRLVNLCAEVPPDNSIVVSSAARNMEALARFAGTLDHALEELNRELVTLWVVNRQRDSLEMLRMFMETFEQAKVHVFMNEYFGREEKFELYRASNTKKALDDRGGKSLVFPELADRVADDIYTKRLAIAEAMKSLPIGNRAELHRWRGEVGKVMAEVTGG